MTESPDSTVVAPAPEIAPETLARLEYEAREKRGAHYALEICFLGFIGVIVVLAFIEALSYKIVSSRTPFVIMVPLLILIAVQARRLWRVRDQFHPGRRILIALKGEHRTFNKVVGFSGWMVVMVLIITVFGHYAGMFLFCVILMRFVADETWMMALLVAAGTTLFIYGVFEFIFNVDLYRGLVLRWFLGYRDF
jgi:tripartite tricarboxylate transporter TctB family protein